MRDIYKMQQELKEFLEELTVLCTEDGKLFLKGCKRKNSKRVNEIAKRVKNLRFNINQQKQKL